MTIGPAASARSVRTASTFSPGSARRGPRRRRSRNRRCRRPSRWSPVTMTIRLKPGPAQATGSPAASPGRSGSSRTSAPRDRAVDADEDDRRALDGGPPSDVARPARQARRPPAQKSAVPTADRAGPRPCPTTPAPGVSTTSVGIASVEAALARGVDDRAREDVRRRPARADAASRSSDRRPRSTGRARDRSDLDAEPRPAGGERAGLVEQQRRAPAASVSSGPPPLTMMPRRAAREMPATIAIGAARSSGQGVATTRTASAADRVARDEPGDAGERRGSAG